MPFWRGGRGPSVPPPIIPPDPSNFRLHLKRIDPNVPMPDKDSLYKLTFKKLTAPLTGLKIQDDRILAFADQNSTIDLLLTPTARTEFAKLNLKPMTPPDITASRTLIIRQIDESIGNRTSDELTAELTKNHPDLKLTATTVPGRNRFFKILCNDSCDVNKILDDGLLLFNMRISPNQIVQQTFTPLKLCFKCYEFEDHSTADCKSTATVCSECATVGHTHKDCRSLSKHCINCRKAGKRDDHRTLAANCPVRKDATNKRQTKTATKTD